MSRIVIKIEIHERFFDQDWQDRRLSTGVDPESVQQLLETLK